MARPGTRPDPCRRRSCYSGAALSTPPTNPKKRSLMPSTPLRRKLRGHGHALAAIVQIGKDGVGTGVINHIQDALFTHELIKVKVGAECPADRFAVAERLSAGKGVSVVQVLGRTILLYKRHPVTPRYEGPRAAGPPDAE